MPTLPEHKAKARFEAARVAGLATLAPDGRPQLVPIVFAVEGDIVYSAVDAKPKTTRALARLANVRADPRVSLLADHYDDDDWSRLWWVRAEGTARVLPADATEARRGVELLQRRYAQHRTEPPLGPVLATDVSRWTGWTAGPPGP